MTTQVEQIVYCGVRTEKERWPARWIEAGGPGPLGPVYESPARQETEYLSTRNQPPQPSPESGSCLVRRWLVDLH